MSDDGAAGAAGDGGEAGEAGAADDGTVGTASDGGDHGATGTGDADGRRTWTPAALAALREDDDRRRVALALAVLVGLAASWVHWLGLFLAGAAVGLVSRSLPRALAAGLGTGALVLVVHLLASPVVGPGELLALAPASYVTVGAALAAPLWGSLVRGVV